MDANIIYIIIGVAALVIGAILGRFIFAKNTKKQIEEADQQARKIVADSQITAENLKKEKLLEAKEKFVQLKAEHEKEVLEKNRRLGEAESRIKQKEQGINQKSDNLDKQAKENDAIKDN